MTSAGLPQPQAPGGGAADLLTRQEASSLLQAFHIRLKPASLARIWCVGGNGPPAIHIGRRPYYPRQELEAWARQQRTPLRRSGRDPQPLRGSPG